MIDKQTRYQLKHSLIFIMSAYSMLRSVKMVVWAVLPENDSTRPDCYALQNRLTFPTSIQMSNFFITVLHSGFFKSLQKFVTISDRIVSSSFVDCSICGVTSARSE